MCGVSHALAPPQGCAGHSCGLPAHQVLMLHRKYHPLPGQVRCLRSCPVGNLTSGRGGDLVEKAVSGTPSVLTSASETPCPPARAAFRCFPPHSLLGVLLKSPPSLLAVSGRPLPAGSHGACCLARRHICELPEGGM